MLFFWCLLPTPKTRLEQREHHFIAPIPAIHNFFFVLFESKNSYLNWVERLNSQTENQEVD